MFTIFNSMNRKYIVILILFLAVLVIHLLKIPLELILIKLKFRDNITLILSSNFPRFTILLLSTWYILKHHNLRKITAICSPFKLNNPQVLLIPIFIFGLATINNIVEFIELDKKLVFLSVLKNLLIGFSEEFVFRGILIYLFLLVLYNKKFKGIYAVLFSSMLFGIIHYINYFKIWNIEEVTSQVIFSFGMGCFLGGLFLKTGNIYAVSILHFLYNFGFSKMPLQDQETSMVIEQTYSLTSIFMGWLLLGILIFSGLYMSRPSKNINLSFIKL